MGLFDDIVKGVQDLFGIGAEAAGEELPSSQVKTPYNDTTNLSSDFNSVPRNWSSFNSDGAQSGSDSVSQWSDSGPSMPDAQTFQEDQPSFSFPDLDADRKNSNGSLRVAPDRMYQSSMDTWNAMVNDPEAAMYGDPEGAALLATLFGDNNPYMTVDGQRRHLIQDDAGQWKFNTNAYQDLNNAFSQDRLTGTSGDLADAGYYVYRGEDGSYNLMPRDSQKAAEQGAIGWYGMAPLEDPTQYERDAYATMGSNEFKQWLADNGYGDLKDYDMNSLLYDNAYTPAFMKFHDMMHNLGYYEGDYTNPEFLDENGQFSDERYIDWVNNNTSLYDYAMNQIGDAGRDWMTSGGIGGNRLLAQAIANLPNLRVALGDMSDEDIQAYLNAQTSGSLSMDDNGYWYLPSQDFGIGRSDAGDWFIANKNADGQRYGTKEMAEYLTQNIIQDALTNPALDYQYGAYNPNYSMMNQYARSLGNPDIYTDEGGPVENQLEYWGAAPEEYDPSKWWYGSYGDILSSLQGKGNRDFRLGATGGQYNQNLRRLFSD